MTEEHLKIALFTNSVCGSLNKIKERLKKIERGYWKYPCKKDDGISKRYSRGIPLASRGKHQESKQNFNGIPLEYRWNTAAVFVQIYACFPELSR